MTVEPLGEELEGKIVDAVMAAFPAELQRVWVGQGNQGQKVFIEVELSDTPYRKHALDALEAVKALLPNHEVELRRHLTKIK